MVYISSQPLMPAVILSFLSSQVASLMQAYKDHDLYFSGMIPVVLWYMNARSYVDLGLPLPPLSFTCPKNIRIYIETAIVVVISYASLLIMDWSYIWLGIFPIIAIGFIAALCNEFSLQSGSQQQSNGDGEASAGRKAEGLEAVAMVPYWALCVMGQLHADTDRFAVSQFLLFFSVMLGALTLMMTRLALAIAGRGLAPASELLQKASLLVLLVAVHAVAVELLGEKAVLFCLPEIAPVLLWFSLHLDGDDVSVVTADDVSVVTADEMRLDINRLSNHKKKLRLSILGATPAFFLALIPDHMDESVLYWCTKASVSCGVSGLLVHYLVFLVCQWPGQDGTAAPLPKLWLFWSWANFLLIAASTLLLSTAMQVAVLVHRQERVEVVSGSQILRRICEKILEYSS